MTQQDRIKEQKLLLEAGFFAALAIAKKAGNEAVKDWDPDDWYPCGAAYVMIKPRNSKFAKWLVREEWGRDAEYKKSVLISWSTNTQAMKPNLAFASAVAKVLRESFSINASVWSWVD